MDTPQSKIAELRSLLTVYISRVGHWSHIRRFLVLGTNPERASVLYVIRVEHQWGLDRRQSIQAETADLYLWIANTIAALEIHQVNMVQPVILRAASHGRKPKQHSPGVGVTEEEVKVEHDTSFLTI
jgi:hypothetical protein